MWHWDTAMPWTPQLKSVSRRRACRCVRAHTHTHTHTGAHIQMASGLRSNLLGYFIFKAVIFLQTRTKESSGGQRSAKKVLLLFWSHLWRSQLLSKCDVVYFVGHGTHASWDGQQWSVTMWKWSPCTWRKSALLFFHLKEINQPIQGDTGLMTVTKTRRHFLFLLLQQMSLAVLLSWTSKKISPNDSNFLMISYMKIEFTSLFCAWSLHQHSNFKGIASSWGEGNGNPLRYSCLENPRDRGAWRAAVHTVAQSRTQLKWLSSSSSSCLLMTYFSDLLHLWYVAMFGF